MKFKSSIAWMITVLTLASTLIACGSKDNNENTPTDTKGSETVLETETETDAATESDTAPDTDEQTEAKTEATTSPSTQAPEATEAETEKPSGSCGSVIGSGAILAILALGTAVVAKKKKD